MFDIKGDFPTENLSLSGKPPNVTLRVISRIEQPFVMFKMHKDGDEVLYGNDRFEVGFSKYTFCFLSFKAESTLEVEVNAKSLLKKKNAVHISIKNLKGGITYCTQLDFTKRVIRKGLKLPINQVQLLDPSENY